MDIRAKIKICACSLEASVIMSSASKDAMKTNVNKSNQTKPHPKQSIQKSIKAAVAPSQRGYMPHDDVRCYIRNCTKQLCSQTIKVCIY